MEELQRRLAKLKEIYVREKAIKERLEEERKEQQELREKLQRTINNLNLEQVLLVEASAAARKQAAEILEKMDTDALQYIMGNHLSVGIRLDESGATPTAEFVVYSDYPSGRVETDPAEGDGGGVADIISLTSFIALLQLAGQKNTAPLFLDEPTKYVSKGHAGQVANFLAEINRYYKRQMFVVTHDPVLASAADNVYEMVLENGITNAKKA